MEPKTLVLVTGCHRSGTSAVAGCLSKLGVSLGDNLMPASPANPRGYFEDLAAVAAHDGLLASVGASWDQPPKGGTHYPGLALAKTRAQVRGIVRRLPGPVCAVKDPRATFFVWLWRDVCRGEGVRFRVLHVCRHPQDVIASLRKREGWDFERAWAVEKAYAMEAEYALRQQAAEFATIQFPWDLYQAAAWYLVFAKLGIEDRLPAVDMRVVREFFDPELIHHG